MVEFAYDYLGRRVQKKVSTRTGGQWVLTLHRQYVWDGWLLLMELDGLGGAGVPPVRRYTWGLDLAGLVASGAPAGRLDAGFGAPALQAAGGIGGLLAMSDPNDPNDPADTWGDFVYTYDGNGNVGQLIDWSHDPNDPNGAIVARYEYDPYGNVTAQAGPYAALNPWRFSTKQWDDDTGLGYWGYRYYDGSRWISRDPVEEEGGANVYVYCANSPSHFVDAHGLEGGLGPFAQPLPPAPSGPCGGPPNGEEWAPNPYRNSLWWNDNPGYYLGRYLLHRGNYVLSPVDAYALMESTPAVRDEMRVTLSEAVFWGRANIPCGETAARAFRVPSSGSYAVGVALSFPWNVIVGQFKFDGIAECSIAHECLCCPGCAGYRITASCAFNLGGRDKYDFHTPGLRHIPGQPYDITWTYATSVKRVFAICR
jgi:RHS repeat-associated protein